MYFFLFILWASQPFFTWLSFSYDDDDDDDDDNDDDDDYDDDHDDHDDDHDKMFDIFPLPCC